MCSCEDCNCNITLSVGEKGDTGATGATGAAGANGTNGATGGQVQDTIIANTGTVTLTEGQTGGKVILDRASGSIITLPDTPADGTNYEFITKTDLSSNNYQIDTGVSGLDTFSGFVFAKKAATADEIFSANGGLYTSITMNGTTSGGDLGTNIKVSYSETENKWYTSGYYYGSGVLVTPFS